MIVTVARGFEEECERFRSLNLHLVKRRQRPKALEINGLGVSSLKPPLVLQGVLGSFVA